MIEQAFWSKLLHTWKRWRWKRTKIPRLWHAFLPCGRCSPVPASQSFPAQSFSIRATLPKSIRHPKQTPGTPGGSMTTVGSHLMPTIPWYVGITNDQNLGFLMHKSNSALYLSKPPRLGVMGWEVQASSPTASYCMPSSYLATLKMKSTLPSQIWKTQIVFKSASHWINISKTLNLPK